MTGPKLTREQVLEMARCYARTAARELIREVEALLSAKPETRSAKTPDTQSPPRLLRLPKVMAMTGLGRDSVYRMAAAGNFPQPRKIGARASAWLESEIVHWIETRKSP